MGLKDVLRELPKLEAGELKAVREKVTALLALTSGEKAPTTTVPKAAQLNDDYILDGLHYELRRRGLLWGKAHIPEGLITPKYVKLSEEVRELFVYQLGPLPGAAKVSLGRLCGCALASYLEKGRVPISCGTLVRNVDKVPAALDASYPGYLEAGLLSYCWK